MADAINGGRLSRDEWQRLLRTREHRPYPLPESAFWASMSWHDLLFAHWPVPVDELRAAVPAGLELDLWQGEAWLGVVPFHMTQVGPPALNRLPWLSAFAELNVRTYVRHAGKSGVYFFSLDAASWPAVVGARVGFRLPYFWAHIARAREGNGVRYASRRLVGPRARFQARYGPRADPFRASPGSFEHWLTERYCLYTTDRTGGVYRGDIHHGPWPLQAAEAEITENELTGWTGLRPRDTPPVLHFARRLDVLAWALVAA
jgi:uncharacterized protein YqjF (DUF2071 family)